MTKQRIKRLPVINVHKNEKVDHTSTTWSIVMKNKKIFSFQKLYIFDE